MRRDTHFSGGEWWRGGPQKASVEEVKRLLDVLDNAEPGAFDYDTWIAVGMAVKGALGQEGMEAWVEWSRLSSVCGVQSAGGQVGDIFAALGRAGGARASGEGARTVVEGRGGSIR